MADPLRAPEFRPADALLHSQWQGIKHGLRQHQRARRKRAWLGALFAAATLCAMVAIGIRLTTAPPSVLQTGNADTQTWQLEDGSRVELRPQTRLQVSELSQHRVVLDLVLGSIHLDVVPRAERRVTVRAGKVKVEVQGTRFSVTRLGGSEATLVQVFQGSVRVSQGTTSSVTLRDGESWSNGPENSRAQAEAAASVAKGGAGPAPPALAKPAPQIPAPTARNPPSAPSDAPAGSPADALFADAEEAMARGDHGRAARLYDDFRKRFPSDPRAGVAAFSSARLRLDKLSDAHGALAALEDARRQDARLAEDIAARELQALDRLENWTRCRHAQAEFLTRYKNSPHTATVKRLCAVRSRD